MLKKVKNTLIGMSVIYIILGVVMLMFPEQVSNIICYLVSFMFIFFGVAGIVMYSKTIVKTSYTNTTLVLSILLGAFGIYILLNPRAFVSFIPLLIGIFLIIDAATKLSTAFDLKKYGYNNWWSMLITASIILAFGLILVFNPFKAVKLYIMVIGVMLIVDAITNILTIYNYSKVVVNEKELLTK